MGGLRILSEDAGFVLRRGWRDSAEGSRNGVLVVVPASEQPTPATLDRLPRHRTFRKIRKPSYGALAVVLKGARLANKTDFQSFTAPSIHSIRWLISKGFLSR